MPTRPSSWSKSPWREESSKKKSSGSTPERPDLDRKPDPRSKKEIEDRVRKNRQARIQREKERRHKHRLILEKARQEEPEARKPARKQTDAKEPSRKKKTSKKKSGPTPWRLPMEKLQGVQKQSDRLLLQIVLVLLALGLVMVLSAGSYRAIIEYEDPSFFFKRQLFFAVFGLLALFVMSIFNADFIRQFSAVGMLLVFGLLILVMLIGDEAMGAKRWLEIGSIRFSPSDLAKPVTVVFIAHVLSVSHKALQQVNGFLLITGISLFIPVVIAIEDLGTAIALTIALFAMLIVAGAPLRYTGLTVAIGTALALIGVLSQDYRIARVTSFLDPFSPEHVQGEGWQLVQSLYALGSGGLAGVGLGNSGQKLLYLPEMHTDFIFSVIAEELGFIGAGLVVFLFLVFVWRGYWISMRIEDSYKSLCCFGLVSVIGAQAFINIGVAVGVFPITGITLPFISYGGTSLVVSLAAVGYILNLSRYMTPVSSKEKRK